MVDPLGLGPRHPLECTRDPKPDDLIVTGVGRNKPPQEGPISNDLVGNRDGVSQRVRMAAAQPVFERDLTLGIIQRCEGLLASLEKHCSRVRRPGSPDFRCLFGHCHVVDAHPALANGSPGLGDALTEPCRNQGLGHRHLRRSLTHSGNSASACAKTSGFERLQRVFAKQRLRCLLDTLSDVDSVNKGSDLMSETLLGAATMRLLLHLGRESLNVSSCSKR